MKTLIYQVNSYSHIYNEETDEVEKKPSLSLVTVENPTDEDIAMAQTCAWNGEYTVKDDGKPEPEHGKTSVWDELDAAYQEGVDSV